MDAGGLTLLEEMVLVCWSLSFIDEDDASADTMEPIPIFFSAPSAESEFWLLGGILQEGEADASPR